MTERTLGSLTAGDLLSTITFTVGGATYTGQLSMVEHGNWGIEPHLRTNVHLWSEGWSHTDRYPSSTPCKVVAGAQPPPKEDDHG
jgi:hypothetical protein